MSHVFRCKRSPTFMGRGVFLSIWRCHWRASSSCPMNSTSLCLELEKSPNFFLFVEFPLIFGWEAGKKFLPPTKLRVELQFFSFYSVEYGSMGLRPDGLPEREQHGAYVLDQIPSRWWSAESARNEIFYPMNIHKMSHRWRIVPRSTTVTKTLANWNW